MKSIAYEKQAYSSYHTRQQEDEKSKWNRRANEKIMSSHWKKDISPCVWKQSKMKLHQTSCKHFLESLSLYGWKLRWALQEKRKYQDHTKIGVFFYMLDLSNILLRCYSHHLQHINRVGNHLAMNHLYVLKNASPNIDVQASIVVLLCFHTNHLS